jgi:hypothetical protein
MLTVAAFAMILGFMSTNEAISQERNRQSNIQLKNPEGREFWITFMRNHNNPSEGQENNLELELFLTSDFDSRVVIEIGALDYSETVLVPAGTVRNVKIPLNAQITSSEKLEESMAVHVTSDRPITAYGLNRRKQTTDTFLALPVEVIGKEYRAMCYNVSAELMSQFAIVATEDNTKVTIRPSAVTFLGRPPGVPFTIELDKGDVYQVAAQNTKQRNAKDDLTGTLVTSDKKISFFSGHQCAYVPDNIIACNHLVEQMPPISSWGRNFYLGDLTRRSKSTYRVLADRDGTKVFENSELVAELGAGEYYEKQHSQPLQITSNLPILVAQFSQGNKNGDAIGDPAMILVSPTQQFLKSYRFATPVNGFWEHYINIVIPTDYISSVRLDGNKIAEGLFSKIGVSRYSLAHVMVSFGTHEITADEKFGLISYGFGYDKDKYDAYGNISGQSFVDYKIVEDKSPPRIELGDDDRSLIIRDDGNNDFGLVKVDYPRSSNIRIPNKRLESGTPQLVLNTISIVEPKKAHALIRAVDVSGNTSYATLCYDYDPLRDDFVYSLYDGDVDCEDPLLGIDFTAFAGYSNGYGFSGDILRNQEEQFATGVSGNLGWYGGFKVSRRVFSSIDFGARVQFQSAGPTLWAIDSSGSFYFDEATGTAQPINIRQNFSVGQSIMLGLTGDYIISEKFSAGIEGGMMINLTDGPLAREFIVKPPNGIFENGDSQRDIYEAEGDEQPFIYPYVAFNLSYEAKITGNWYFTPELRYTLPIGYSSDFIEWIPQMIGGGIGLTYKL